jgi:hypothetical protein
MIDSAEKEGKITPGKVRSITAALCCVVLSHMLCRAMLRGMLCRAMLCAMLCVMPCYTAHFMLA